jgi:hypothetical protein
MNKLNLKFNLIILIKASFFLLLFIFYFWTGSNGILKRLYEEKHGGPSTYPMMLSAAFLKGNTYIDIKPKPELLALADPYDPNLNDHYRMHDASLYNDKYYIYFSPVIPLLVIAPVRLITGYYVSENFLVPLFAFLGFLFSCATIKKIFALSTSIPKSIYMYTCFFALAMLTNIPFLLRRPAVYELSIISAYFFLMAGIYYYICSIDKKNPKPTREMLIAGIFFGLCFASRPNQILIIILLIIGYFFLRKNFLTEKKGETLYLLTMILIPFSVICIFLGIYNYVRFDSFFEFGMKYQLSGIDVKNVPSISIGRFFANLYAYFLHPFKLVPNFPFIHITEPLKPEALKAIWFTERTLGIFSYPFFWLTPLFYFSRKELKKDNPLLYSVLSLLFLSALVCVILLSQLHGVTMRYTVDFIPLILIVSLVGYFYSTKYVFVDNSVGKLIASYLFYASISLSCLISIFSSFTGTYNVLESINPELFNKLYSFFWR